MQKVTYDLISCNEAQTDALYDFLGVWEISEIDAP